MRYLLQPQVALRSWRLVPYAYYWKGERNAFGLKKEEYELLCCCDGKQELEESSLLSSLMMRGLCAPCQGEGELTPWQKPRFCDNRYFPALNWMITGKCNYNCLHCFNAADNAPLMSEFTWEEALSLINQADRCGINAFTITGGEPMLHRHFFPILEAIYDRGMYVEELNTNGAFLNEEALQRLKNLDGNMKLKISFDGLGHHDWLRNRRGAEQDALRAIRLSKDYGFPVMVQTNVHRRNLDTLLETAERLDEMGVDAIRIIRTTEAPRWVQNGGDATLGLTEYYDRMLDFLKSYLKVPHSMTVEIWQFASVFPKSRSYRARPVECKPGEYRDSLPVCRGNRGMVAVAANGNVFPCHQLSGYYEEHHDILGNVKTDGLQTLLQGSAYLSEVCTTLGQLKEATPQCTQCRYFLSCAGGCRAIALALTGNKLANDPSKCLFFQNGYYEQLENVMGDWRNLAPLTVK